jgi:hypothetical protein
VAGIFNIMSLKNRTSIYKPKEVNVTKLKKYLKKKKDEASAICNDTSRRRK